MRKMIIGLLLVALSSACSIQTLGAPKGGLTLHAKFDDTQGLVIGHNVMANDVAIGSITKIDLDSDFRAKVTMSIEEDRNIPQGTVASISRTSLLGENYVRLTLPAGRDMKTGPFLADGASFGPTTTQPDLESITEKVGPVLAALGGQSLGTIVDAVATSLKDNGPELNQLVVKLTEVSKTYSEASTDLDKIITGFARLGNALAAKKGDLDAMPAKLTLATERINKDRKELKAAVQELVKLGTNFNATVHSKHGARLQALLTKLDTIASGMLRGKTELKALAKSLDYGVLSAPSMTYKGMGLMQAWIGGILPLTPDLLAPDGTDISSDAHEKRLKQLLRLAGHKP